MSKRTSTFLSFSAAVVASAVALVFVAPGCSDTASGTDTCYDYSGFNGMTPTVTFKTDVLPIFRRSCGLSSACHGTQTPADPKQPFLGPSTNDPDPTQAEIDKIFAQNVGVNAVQATTMKIVDPGSPETSFLMHKVDNTLKCADVKCDAACGLSMPYGSPILAETDRDVVRRWITQGAKND